MRVLIATGVFPPESGGPATYSKTLLDELPAHGFEVDVLPFRDVRKWPTGIRHIVYFFKLLVRTNRFKPDVIFAQDPISVGLPACIAAWMLRKKFVLKVVGDYAWEQSTNRFGYTRTIEYFQTDEENGIVSKIMRYVERRVARAARAVVVPSRYLGTIVEAWGVPKKKIQVVYNGIAATQVGLKQVIRGLLKFKGELVISAGRLVSWKGFDTLIRVHATLVKQRPNLKLLIVGGGPQEKHLETLAEKLGVADSVIFTHRVENAVLLRYLRASDVFALNTSYEGFSHLLLEASAVGVPIVTTRIGGNPEIIEDGVNGYLVAPDDEQALAKRIKELLLSSDTRALLVANAKKRVAEFATERMVEETTIILKKL